VIALTSADGFAALGRQGKKAEAGEWYRKAADVGYESAWIYLECLAEMRREKAYRRERGLPPHCCA
jgi:hypothetical protein